MTPTKSKRKFLNEHKWEIVLFLISSGSIFSFVHIWETPKKLEELTSRVAVGEAFANTLDKRQAVQESNLENETKLVNMMQDTQKRMWDKIEEVRR